MKDDVQNDDFTNLMKNCIYRFPFFNEITHLKCLVGRLELAIGAGSNFGESRSL